MVLSRHMAEARIRVIDKAESKFNELISDEPGRRVVTLNMFEPPITAEHGEDRESAVVIFQGKKIHHVDSGDVKQFKLDNKIIEIVHKGEIYKF